VFLVKSFKTQMMVNWGMIRLLKRTLKPEKAKRYCKNSIRLPVYRFLIGLITGWMNPT